MDVGLAIAADHEGNVVTTGYFYGTADFDPSPLTRSLIAPTKGNQAFVSKLDSQGNLVWARMLKTNRSGYGKAISMDSSGDVLVAGDFRGTTDFNPAGSSGDVTSSGGSDLFVCRLTSTGELEWARRLGGEASDSLSAITLDRWGNIFTTGWFRGTADFDPGSRDRLLSTSGAGEIFISKLDPSGEFVWVQQMGGEEDGDIGDEATDIVVDSANRVYTTGRFDGDADFDPSPRRSVQLTASGIADVFVSQLLDSPFADLRDGRLSIRGTTDNDAISVFLNPSRSNVIVNANGLQQRFRLAKVESIHVRAIDGHDRVIVEAAKIGANISAGRGNDTITGGAGNDTLVGGSGNDLLKARAGHDILRGDDGHDTLFGGGGLDFLVGGGGDDLFYANDGLMDELRGDRGDDTAEIDDVDVFSEIETLTA